MVRDPKGWVTKQHIEEKEGDSPNDHDDNGHDDHHATA